MTLLFYVDLLNTVYLHKCTDENSNSSFSVTCNYTAILSNMLAVYSIACLKVTTNTGFSKALQSTSCLTHLWLRKKNYKESEFKLLALR